jgi:beta-carotene/zeaxanthin 4-ketolase
LTSEGSSLFNNLGLVWAIVIMSLWIGTLIIFLGLDLAELSPIHWAAIVLIRTFFHTGLFILAHDAMHGSLIPSSASINQGLGRLCLGLYAVLPYDRVQTNHHKHHHSPGQPGDPDFHNGIHQHPLFWYFQFLGAYVSITQMTVFITVIGCGLAIAIFLLHVSVANCILVWMVPLILSSLQLFCFGTYFPHRNESTGPQSTYYPNLLSLLICYHFSYHQEHHLYPDVAWYRLPSCDTIRYNKIRKTIQSNNIS